MPEPNGVVETVLVRGRQINRGYLIDHNGEEVRGDVIGRGVDGIILRHGPDAVLKITKRGALRIDGVLVPNKWDAVDTLKGERAAYTRLRFNHGIANCRRIFEHGVELEYYPKGNMQDYIHEQSDPGFATKQRWIATVIDAIAACHESSVLVFDVFLRNLMITNDMGVKLLDFSQSCCAPLDADLQNFEDAGASTALDIAHLGSIIYSIAAWVDYSCSCDTLGDWPSIEDLPDTKHVLFSSIVRRCWTRGYDCIYELQKDFRLSSRQRRRRRLHANHGRSPGEPASAANLHEHAAPAKTHS